MFGAEVQSVKVNGWIVALYICVWIRVCEGWMSNDLVTEDEDLGDDVGEGRQAVIPTVVTPFGNFTFSLVLPLLLGIGAKITALLPLGLSLLAGIGFLGLLVKKTLAISLAALLLLIYQKFVHKLDGHKSLEHHVEPYYHHVHVPQSHHEHVDRRGNRAGFDPYAGDKYEADQHYEQLQAKEGYRTVFDSKFQ